MTTYSKGRRGRPWRRLRLEVLRANPVCTWCGRRINLSIPYRDPVTGRVNMDSGTVDHDRSLIDHPHLALERSNLRPFHLLCNLQKGDGRPKPSKRSRLLPLGQRSRSW